MRIVSNIHDEVCPTSSSAGLADRQECHSFVSLGGQLEKARIDRWRLTLQTYPDRQFEVECLWNVELDYEMAF